LPPAAMAVAAARAVASWPAAMMLRTGVVIESGSVAARGALDCGILSRPQFDCQAHPSHAAECPTNVPTGDDDVSQPIGHPQPGFRDARHAN